MEQKTASRARIHFMDEVRGFAVFCMVFYHGFYSLAYMFHLAWAEWLLNFFMPAEPYFAALFIFISGISSDLSHSNRARGWKLLGVAVLVSVVTAVAVPDEFIVFGILHFLSCAMLLFSLVQEPLRRVPMGAGMLACALLFAATCQLPQRVICFAVPLPAALYATDWLAPLGIYSSTFRSADYFPLLPWSFVFLAGTFFGRLAAEERFPKWMYRRHAPFFSFLGTHALVIYVLHQPVIFALTALIELLL